MIILALAGWGAISAVGNKWMASGSMVVGRRGGGVGGEGNFIELWLGCGY